jgi:hypothetical protein
MRRSRNPVGEFNTAGQDKCPHCGDYFPSAWAASHIDSCTKNPKNITKESDTPS